MYYFYCGNFYYKSWDQKLYEIVNVFKSPSEIDLCNEYMEEYEHESGDICGVLSDSDNVIIVAMHHGENLETFNKDYLRYLDKDDVIKFFKDTILC
jgi:hypothetical protein